MARILYKYIDIVGAKCMLANQKLQFTNASQLNDPFDCHPKLLDYSNVPKRKLQGWIPEEWWIMKEETDALNLRNETWLCSLSKVNDSILMWAHYCYNHKGVCIGLDLGKVMESVPPMFGTIHIKPLVLDVQYKSIIERPDGYCDTIDLFYYQWQTKAKEWEYEQEVRLVMPQPNMQYAALTPEQAKHPKDVWERGDIHVYMSLKPECFDSIYFGVNTDEAEKEKMIKFARKMLNPQIKLYQMRVDADAFKLQPEAIKPLNSDLSESLSLYHHNYIYFKHNKIPFKLHSKTYYKKTVPAHADTILSFTQYEIKTIEILFPKNLKLHCKKLFLFNNLLQLSG